VSDTRAKTPPSQPAAIERNGRRTALASLTAGILALAVYLATMPPGLTWANDGADGGDLISAAYVLGVPHPPGYPLYVALGHLVARLPLGPSDIGLRFNVLSALMAAGAVALFVQAASRRQGPTAGLVAGLVLAFGSIYWSQAIIAEVYAFNALAVSILLLLVLSDSPRWEWIGLVWGISWSTHLSSVLLLPLLVARIVESKTDPWKVSGRIMAGWAVGLLPFCALPLFASQSPPINWGNPTSLARWWWLVSGRLYSSFVLGLPLNQWPGRIASLGGLVVENLTAPGIVLGAWSAVRFISANRARAIALLATMALFAIYALGYNTADSYVLLLPGLVLAAFLIGWATGEIGRLGPWGRLLSWGTLLIPLYLVLSGWTRADLSTDHEALSFVENVMRQAPPDALIYTETDRHTFSLWYGRFVRGDRPDVTIIDRGLLGFPWYLEMLQIQDPRGPLVPLVPGDRPLCTVSRQGRLSCGS
jgi:hypothetical protein